MNAPDGAGKHLSLAPLGAGDLIDRAVRFYRKYFFTFIHIAAPPVIVGTLVSVAWTIGGRQLFSVDRAFPSPETTLYYLFIGLGSIAIWLTETIATLVIMGGASRNFVRHLLFGEAITFRETYRNAWQRLGALTVASSFISISLGLFGIFVFYLALIIASLAILLAIAAFTFFPLAAFLLSVAIGLGVALAATWFFFLIASRLAFVPQVMLVEGQGVFASIGRSISLAGGSGRRLAALFIFSTVATYSALALLYVPLAWYASANGVQLMSFDADIIPAWYEIAYNLIWQISFILLTPVWMVGLCLLYIDERVRSEGYDIELMAAARLGEIPSVPSAFANPLQPALSANTSTERRNGPPFTTLGLK